MMDLQPAIFEFLCRYHKIGLPGLGSLQWLYHRAERKNDRFLQPPSLQIQHSRQAIDSDDFVRFLSSKTRISRSRIQTIFEQWCKDQMQQLSKGKKVILEGLGFFQQEKNQISFHSTIDPQQAHFYMKKKELSFADHNQFNEHTPPLTELTRNEDDNSFTWLEWILPAILIGLIALLLYFLWMSFNDPPNIVTDPSEEKSEIPIDSLNQSDTDKSRIDSPIRDEIDSISDAVNEETDTTIYQEEEIKNGEEQKVITRASQGECIVVIGSFTRPDLAQRAIEKVISLGMNAYTEPYKEFQRVGVIFDCETEDLYRKLFQLRGDFGSDAWILKYK